MSIKQAVERMKKKAKLLGYQLGFKEGQNLILKDDELINNWIEQKVAEQKQSIIKLIDEEINYVKNPPTQMNIALVMWLNKIKQRITELENEN